MYNSDMTKLQTTRRTQAERTRASKEKIIQAATEYFALYGFHGTKMADIARAASLTEPGLLHHFPSKVHLLMGVLEYRDRVDSERTRQLHQEQEGSHFIDAAVELVEHNQHVPGLVQLFTLLVAESLSPEHPAHDFFVQRYQRERGKFVELIRAAQQAGEIRNDLQAESLAVLLFSVMDGLQVQWLLEPEKINMASVFRMLLEILKPGS